MPVVLEREPRRPVERSSHTRADAIAAHVRVEVAGQRVAVTGAIGVRSSGEVRDALALAIAGGEGRLYLDLAGAEVWDATGLGVLVGAHDRAERAGRTLVLCSVSPRLHRLLRSTRLERVLQVHDVVEPSISVPA